MLVFSFLGFPAEPLMSPSSGPSLILVSRVFCMRLGTALTYVLGVDYDMSGCTPGDLDPHAVASIFKAFLRERECYK